MYEEYLYHFIHYPYILNKRKHLDLQNVKPNVTNGLVHIPRKESFEIDVIMKLGLRNRNEK